MRTVAHIRRNNQSALPSDFHPGNTSVPTLDYPACAKQKRKRCSAIAGTVELRTLLIRSARIIKPAGIMHFNGLAYGCLFPGSYFGIVLDEFGHAGRSLPGFGKC